jgi:hypothetical protein
MISFEKRVDDIHAIQKLREDRELMIELRVVEPDYKKPDSSLTPTAPRTCGHGPLRRV